SLLARNAFALSAVGMTPAMSRQTRRRNSASDAMGEGTTFSSFSLASISRSISSETVRAPGGAAAKDGATHRVRTRAAQRRPQEGFMRLTPGTAAGDRPLRHGSMVGRPAPGITSFGIGRSFFRAGARSTVLFLPDRVIRATSLEVIEQALVKRVVGEG